MFNKLLILTAFLIVNIVTEFKNVQSAPITNDEENSERDVEGVKKDSGKPKI